MEIQFIYAAMRVRDVTDAAKFYAKVLGREPDDRPMDTLVQWRYTNAGIQLFADAENAGHGTMTLVVPDMDAVNTQLAAQGIDTGPIQRGDFGRIARFNDADGNDIVLAEPPPRVSTG